MRSGCVILGCVLILCGGCAPAPSGMRRGTPISHIQMEYGQPDVISDLSGDLERFYVPSRRPPEEWPVEAPRTFYYLDRDLAVTFLEGKAVSIKPLDRGLREGTLVPLVRGVGVEGLQTVFGPQGVRLHAHPLSLDLNGDGEAERLVLLANPGRGLKFPERAADLRKGAVVNGFALFGGIRPNVAVFYQYRDSDGLSLWLDEVDGRTLLVSDGGRDHGQQVWGWCRYEESWPDRGSKLCRDRLRQGRCPHCGR